MVTKTDNPFSVEEFIVITDKNNLLHLPDGRTARLMNFSSDQLIDANYIVSVKGNLLGLRKVENQKYDFLAWRVKRFF